MPLRLPLCHKSKKPGDGSTVGVDGLSGVGFHPLTGSSPYGACPTVSSIPGDERVAVLFIIPTVLEELHVNVQLEHLLPLLRVGFESTSRNKDSLRGVDSIPTRWCDSSSPMLKGIRWPQGIFQKVKPKFCVAI